MVGSLSVSKLIIGSGDWHWPGYVTLDADASHKPDLVATVPPLPKVVMEIPWGEIVMSHVIEHIHPWEAKDLLKQCYSCLAEGGKLILEQPDIRYCAEVLCGIRNPPPGRDLEQFSLWGIYGGPHGNPWDSHKWGYTPGSLKRVLEEVGFKPYNIILKQARYHEKDRDFLLECTKD